MTSTFIQGIVARLSDPVLVFSRSGRLEAVNEAGVDLTGLSHQALQRTALADFVDTGGDDTGFIQQLLLSTRPLFLRLKLPGVGAAPMLWQGECFRLDGLDDWWLGIRMSQPAGYGPVVSEKTAALQHAPQIAVAIGTHIEGGAVACVCSEHGSTPEDTSCGYPADRQSFPDSCESLLQSIRNIAHASQKELALQAAITEVCQFAGWDYAEVWVPDDTSGTWRPHPYWFGNRDLYQSFRSLSAVKTEDGSLPLIERVASTGVALWYEDVSVVPFTEYLRADAAGEAGLKATFAQAVTHNGKTLAVLVFMATEARSRDSAAVELVDTVSAQLSDVFHGQLTTANSGPASLPVQRQAPLDTDDSGSDYTLDLLCTLLDAVDRPAFVVNLHERVILWANPTACQLFGYEAKELLGNSSRMLHVDQRSYEEFGQQAQPFVANNKAFHHRFWLRRKDGSRFASEHLVTPVRNVGEAQIAVSLVTDLSAPAMRRFGKQLERLSPREYDVLQLTIDGFSVKEIASRLDLSHRTVDIHRANLLKKLEVSSTTKLLAEVLVTSIVERAQL